MPTSTVIKKSKQPADSNRSYHARRTILFNCDCHSFDEVETQLIKAIRCTLSKAREIAWKVHRTGSAVVYTGHLERCEAVAMTLEDIGLIVNIQ